MPFEIDPDVIAQPEGAPAPAGEPEPATPPTAPQEPAAPAAEPDWKGLYTQSAQKIAQLGKSNRRVQRELEALRAKAAPGNGKAEPPARRTPEEQLQALADDPEGFVQALLEQAMPGYLNQMAPHVRDIESIKTARVVDQFLANAARFPNAAKHMSAIREFIEDHQDALVAQHGDRMGAWLTEAYDTVAGDERRDQIIREYEAKRAKADGAFSEAGRGGGAPVQGPAEQAYADMLVGAGKGSGGVFD